MSVDAADKNQAVRKLAAMMGPEATAQHMKTKHPGEPIPSQAQIKAMIEQGLQQA